MTTTPVYGIRGPDGSTKAKDLPAALSQQNLDIEAALLLAQIPPTVPANVYVAPTAAARDLKFGKPTTANARLALQNSGALCMRTDLRYIEQYFAGATDGGANAGGVTTPGWYPVAGSMPSIYYESNGGNAADGTYMVLPITAGISADGRGVITRSGNVLTAVLPGFYDISGQVLFSTNGNGSRSLMAYLNGQPFPAPVRASTLPADDLGLPLTSRVYLAAGSNITAIVRQSSGATLGVAGRFSLTWAGPGIAPA